jgi:hypothetical protein
MGIKPTSSFFLNKKNDKYYWVIAMLIMLTVYACGPSKEEMEAKEALQHPLATASTISEGVYRLPSSNTSLSGGQYVNITINKHEYISGWGGSYHGGPFIAHKGECNACEKRNIFLIDSIIRTALNSCVLKRKK